MPPQVSSHAQPDLAVGPARRDSDDTVGGRVPDRVGEQVAHHPHQRGTLAECLRDVGRDVDLEPDPATVGGRPRRLHRVAEHLGDGYRLEVQAEVAGVDAGQLEEVVDHAGQPIRSRCG